MIQTIFDSIYGIIFTVIGLLFLFAPHDTITRIFPKAPSKAVVKVLGAIIAFCGIVMVALSVVGIEIL